MVVDLFSPEMGLGEPKLVGGFVGRKEISLGVLPMPSKKPKIQAYVSEVLYRAVRDWKVQNGIDGDSEAIERLLSMALELPSERDIPHAALEEIYQRLDELDDRLGKLKGVARGVEGSENSRGEGAILSPDGISLNELVRRCGTGKRQLMRIRDDASKLASFTLRRTGVEYEYRDGRYFPVGEGGRD